MNDANESSETGEYAVNRIYISRDKKDSLALNNFTEEQIAFIVLVLQNYRELIQ